MDNRDIERETELFKQNLKVIARTEEGDYCLRFLWKQYVIGALANPDVAVMAYNVAQRDLILGLFDDLEMTSPSYEDTTHD